VFCLGSLCVCYKKTPYAFQPSRSTVVSLWVVRPTGRRTSPGHFPRTFPLFFCIPGHFPLTYDERVRGLFPRVWRRRQHADAARLRYRHGGGRQTADAASDLLQRLTTTTTAMHLFRASRRRCSRCPSGTCMSPRWTATTGRGVEWGLRRHCCRMHVASWLTNTISSFFGH